MPDQLQPGPELDARLAVELMGWKRVSVKSRWGRVDWWMDRNGVLVCKVALWHPSTSSALAVEEIIPATERETGGAFASWHDDDGWCATFDHPHRRPQFTATHSIFSGAVCMAAATAEKAMKGKNRT